MKVAGSAFSSKILLFGEYSVIDHSMALCVPYTLFGGTLRFKKKDRYFDKDLSLLIDYLKKAKLNFHLDVERLENDIAQGLYFDSSIPPRLRGRKFGSPLRRPVRTLRLPP